MKIKAYFQRYSYNILIAIEAIFANKIKSFLTALGIIFGVAAVISMLAIGNGAEQEILEQIKLVGVNNIIITPIQPSNQVTSNDQKAGASDATQATNGNGNTTNKTKFSKGLSLLDAESIKEIIPTVKDVCPVVTYNYTALLNGKSSPIKLEGTTNTYFSLFDIRLESGSLFSMQHLINGYPVCIIGYNVKNTFFNQEDPVGKFIKCGQIWLKIIGVIEKRAFVGSGEGTMSISGTDNKIIIPVKTLLLRYRNKSLIRADQIESSGREKNKANNQDQNQLDQVIVQVAETKDLTNTAKVVGKMLLRKHNDVHDFDVSIPELLLKQQQKTKNIFNIVLGAIAGISLIVGGIGIMNIMLASVLERIREIGTRQAIGASRKDIVFQFLSESTLISVSGGLLGIILGIILSKIIQSVFDIKTIISLFSIIVSFGVSVCIGIVFGYVPAKRAAEKDPVESLRQ